MISFNADSFTRSVHQGSRPVLVAYCEPGCRYCDKILPYLRRLASQWADSLLIGHVDVSREPALAREEEIEVVPTLVLYRGGSALGSIVVPESGLRINAFLQETMPDYFPGFTNN